jgi:hypothetical protein
MISLGTQFRAVSRVVLILLIFLTGCGGQKKAPAPAPTPPKAPETAEQTKLSTEGSEVFGTKKPSAPGTDTSWTIVIVSTMGPGMEHDAQLALEKVRTKGSLPQAFVEPRGRSMVVAYGHYPGPDSKEAQADLKRIQSMEIDGVNPFASAILAPPPYDSLPGSVPEYDLSTLKQRRGKDALYTLQVAAYARLDGKPPTDKDLAEFRSAAERAVVELRREGEEAFYHHGPTKSVVTVGVFGPKDVEFVHKDPHNPNDTGEWRESMAVKEAKRRHPLNLVNGAGMKEKYLGQAEAHLQPSRIVVIPN